MIMLDYKIETRDKYVVVTLSGSLDALTTPTIMGETADLFEQSWQATIFEMSRLELIDSTGFGYLITYSRDAALRSRNVALVGMREQPTEIMDLLRHRGTVRTYENIDEAITAIGLKES